MLRIRSPLQANSRFPSGMTTKGLSLEEMKRTILRTLKLSTAGLALAFVVLICAFATMRIAIHGREVAVPNLSGLSDSDAAAAVKKLGLSLSVENRFFSSAVAPNRVLSQLPSAGSRVRRGWQIRVTESLGGQHLEVPDVTGQSERPAFLVLRRLQLEVGTVAHLPAPAPAGIILAQSPPPKSNGLTGPDVSLLVSDPEDAAERASYVMPAIVGLSLGVASTRLATVGLHISSAQEQETTPSEDVSTGTVPATPAASPNLLDPSFEVPASPAPVSSSSVILSQSPQPGHRIARGEAIRVTLAPH